MQFVVRNSRVIAHTPENRNGAHIAPSRFEFSWPRYVGDHLRNAERVAVDFIDASRLKQNIRIQMLGGCRRINRYRRVVDIVITNDGQRAVPKDPEFAFATRWLPVGLSRFKFPDAHDFVVCAAAIKGDDGHDDTKDDNDPKGVSALFMHRSCRISA